MIFTQSLYKAADLSGTDSGLFSQPFCPVLLRFLIRARKTAKFFSRISALNRN